MKCIYCLEDKKSQDDFNKDHVFPESFGGFKKNFTLIGLVCKDCNQYLGDTLERFLARDTIEGTYRFEFGVKELEEFKSVGKRSRLKREVAEGEFKGTQVYLEYSAEQRKIVVQPVPQIGFRKKDSSAYEYFLLDDIPDRPILEEKGFDLNHPQGIMIADKYHSISEKVLIEKGFPSLKYGGEIEPSGNNEDWLCKVEGQIDDIIRRAVAKIAFNYLPFWEGREFVLHSDFDLIRRFIRYDETPPYPLLLIENKSILQDEQGDKIPVGHIVTLAYAADGKSILSEVLIFNLLSYRVCLAKEFSGSLKDIRKGHFFNIKNMEIWLLEARSRL